MREFQHKRKVKKILYSWPVCLLLLVVVVLLIKPVWNVYWKKVESEKNIETVNQELVALKDREVQLSSQMNALNSDTGTEQEIRSKFNVAKEGEKMVIMVDQDKPEAMPVLKNQGFFQTIWNSFVKFF